MVYEAKKRILEGDLEVYNLSFRQPMKNYINSSVRKKKNLEEMTVFYFYQGYLHLHRYK